MGAVSGRLRGLRRGVAHAVWALAVLGALGLAGAALLVALRVDPQSVWGWWLEAADLVTPGWFARPEGSGVAGAAVRDTVLRWGSAAGVLLAAGAVLQWVIRPSR